MRRFFRQLVATKSLAELSQAGLGGNRLRRELSVWQLMTLGVGAMLGTGVYVLAGEAAAHHAGPAVVVSFALAGLAASLAALCYAELASMIPVAGSAYTYVYAAMGELAAFLIGWDLLLEYIMGASLVAIGWSGYFNAFVARLAGGALDPRWTTAPIGWNAQAGGLELTGAFVNLPALLLCVALTAVLIVGVSKSAGANFLMVSVKVIVVFLFLGVALPRISPENLTPWVPPNQGAFGRFGISGVFQCISLLYLGYIGFDAITTAAQESRNAQSDIPKGIMGAMLLCTTLYILVALGLVGLVSYTKLGVPHPLALASAAANSAWLEIVVEAGALLGLASNALVMLLGQPRILYTMAKDGLAPQFAARVHPRFGTPVVTTLIAGAASACLSGFVPIQVIGEMCSIGTMLAFALVGVSVIILRLREPKAVRRFKIPGGAFGIPLLSTLISLALIAGARPATLSRLSVWMLAGLLYYLTVARRSSHKASSIEDRSKHRLAWKSIINPEKELS